MSVHGNESLLTRYPFPARRNSGILGRSHTIEGSQRLESVSMTPIL
jgi:hypothetical protein